MSLIKTSPKNKILISIALLPIIAVGYYLSVYQAYIYKSSNGTTGAAMVVISLMIYPMLWLNMEKTRTQKNLLTGIMVLISLTAIIMLMVLRESYEDRIINSNPVISEAHITALETERSWKGRRTDYAIFTYFFKKRKINQRIYDSNYSIGQVLKIRFSSEYPEMVEVLK